MSTRKQPKEQPIPAFKQRMKREHYIIYMNTYNNNFKSNQRTCYRINKENEIAMVRQVEKELKEERPNLSKCEIKRIQKALYENHYERLNAILEYINKTPDVAYDAFFEFEC